MSPTASMRYRPIPWHRWGYRLSRRRVTAVSSYGDPPGKRRRPPADGDDGRAVAPIDRPSHPDQASPMSAAPHFYEEPPLVSPAPFLTVLPGADVENRLSRAETLTRNNEHAAALEQLDALWIDVHDEAPLTLRHRLAASWAAMYEGRLEDAAAL